MVWSQAPPRTRRLRPERGSTAHHAQYPRSHHRHRRRPKHDRDDLPQHHPGFGHARADQRRGRVIIVGSAKGASRLAPGTPNFTSQRLGFRCPLFSGFDSGTSSREATRVALGIAASPAPLDDEADPAPPYATSPAPGPPAMTPDASPGAPPIPRLLRRSTTPDRTHDPSHATAAAHNTLPTIAASVATAGFTPLSTPSAAGPPPRRTEPPPPARGSAAARARAPDPSAPAARQRERHQQARPGHAKLLEPPLESLLPLFL